jgi:LuxR family maltose regulon positive regulatory protein
MKSHISRRDQAAPIENLTHLERPRIREFLADAVKKPLVIVSAGPGYGKTMAVYSFLRGYPATTTWVQLSPRDNMCTRFWENFALTLSLHNMRLSERLLEIEFPETKDQFEKFFSLAENEISFKEKKVLVFDDFHLIHERSVVQFIERMIEARFPNVTMLLISRTDPDINEVKLLSRGMIASVSENDMRLTEAETAQYLQSNGIYLSSQSVSDIYNDTAGWMLALSLISLSLKKSPDKELNARIAMKMNIFKMMESEVFLVASEKLQRFLMQLSLIEYLSAELVSILAGDDETLVGELRKIGSFVRYDIYLHAYHIHHMFLDYLRQKQGALTEDEKRDVYLKAARWCDDNGCKIDAISYYDKIGEYEAIIDIVYNFPVQIPYNDAKFIFDIYNRAPADVMEGIAGYHLQRVRLLMSLKLYDEAMEDTRRRIGKYSDLPASDFNHRVLCGAYTAFGLTSYLMAPVTDRYDFDVPLKSADYYYQLSPYPEYGPMCSISLSAWASKVGTARIGAMEEYTDALTRAVPYAANVLNGFMYGLDDFARGELQFFKGDLKNAAKFLTQALHKSKERNQYEITNRVLFYLLRIAVARGDFGETQYLLGELKALLGMKDYHARFIAFDIVSGWYYSILGQMDLVADWLSKGSLAKGSVGIANAEFGNFIKAKIYYMDKRYHDLIFFIESGQFTSSVLFGRIEIKLLMAACQYHLKNRSASMEALREAYDMARSNDLTMPFIVLGKDMRTLTMSAMRDENRGIPRQWLELINRKSATYAKRLLIVASEYKKANKVRDNDVQLSAREKEILQDVCDGLSRSEIAVNRDLSINTVKMLLNNIYSKLGADNLASVVKIALNQNLVK